MPQISRWAVLLRMAADREGQDTPRPERREPEPPDDGDPGDAQDPRRLVPAPAREVRPVPARRVRPL